MFVIESKNDFRNIISLCVTINIPYTFYCVRKPEDKTRWSSGVYVESIRLFVKYPTEYQLVIKNHSLY